MAKCEQMLNMLYECGLGVGIVKLNWELEIFLEK